MKVVAGIIIVAVVVVTIIWGITKQSDFTADCEAQGGTFVIKNRSTMQCVL